MNPPNLKPVHLLTLLLVTTAPLACSSSSTGQTGTAPGPAPEGGTMKPTNDLALPAAAFFRGTLAQSVAKSKAYSDPFFRHVEAEAMAAGDDGHDALLGTTDLGTTLDQFVGLDTWKNDKEMDAVYSAPPVQAFAKSFYASPPEFVTFYLSDFYQWGTTDSGDGTTPHYFVFTRGKYASAPAQVKSAHDTTAKGHQAAYEAAGNVAHLVFYGRTDPEEALFVDVWTSRAKIDAFYGDPTLRGEIAALFDAAGPNFGVYGSTDWVTW